MSRKEKNSSRKRRHNLKMNQSNCQFEESQVLEHTTNFNST